MLTHGIFSLSVPCIPLLSSYSLSLLISKCWCLDAVSCKSLLFGFIPVFVSFSANLESFCFSFLYRKQTRNTLHSNCLFIIFFHLSFPKPHLLLLHQSFSLIVPFYPNHYIDNHSSKSKHLFHDTSNNFQFAKQFHSSCVPIFHLSYTIYITRVPPLYYPHKQTRAHQHRPQAFITASNSRRSACNIYQSTSALTRGGHHISRRGCEWRGRHRDGETEMSQRRTKKKGDTCEEWSNYSRTDLPPSRCW